MQKNEVHLEPDCYYHIYNRAVGEEALFYSPENYFYFLKKYREYLSPILETFSYCLIPNHFHFLVRIKNEEVIKKVMRKVYETDEVKITVNLYISKQFSNFFNGYSQAINKQQMRRGTLFTRPFKRKKIDSMEYLRNVTVYIHSNPVNHGLAKGISEWQYSSYKSILLDSNNDLNRKEVISWFEDATNFSIVHQTSVTKDAITIELD
ncbi:hypothetical protein CNR22_04960 [Sphingobacteriaceae bacterium]|nr:hypothetical protein CNR22_04960 [Sphingobacteriaceae bacterium]